MIIVSPLAPAIATDDPAKWASFDIFPLNVEIQFVFGGQGRIRRPIVHFTISCNCIQKSSIFVKAKEDSSLLLLDILQTPSLFKNVPRNRKIFDDKVSVAKRFESYSSTIFRNFEPWVTVCRQEPVAPVVKTLRKSAHFRS